MRLRVEARDEEAKDSSVDQAGPGKLVEEERALVAPGILLRRSEAHNTVLTILETLLVVDGVELEFVEAEAVRRFLVQHADGVGESDDVQCDIGSSLVQLNARLLAQVVLCLARRWFECP